MKEALYTTLCCTVEDISFVGVLDQGFFYHERGAVEAHRHTQPELHVAILGTYRLESVSGEVTLDMKKGDVALVPSGFWHTTAVEEGVAEEYTLRLELSPVRTAEAKRSLFSALSQKLTKTEEGFLSLCLPEALPLLSRMQAALEVHGVGGRAEAEACFRLLSVSLLRGLLADADALEEDARDDAIDRKESLEEILQREYANPDFSLTELADLLGFSVRQVNRLFQLFYGQSFREVLSEIRLYNAQRLLLRTALPMAEVACRVGDREPSGFYIAFRKRFGCSPRQYRLQNGIE